MRGHMGVMGGMDETNYQQEVCHQGCTDTTKHIGLSALATSFFSRSKVCNRGVCRVNIWGKFKSRKPECIPRNTNTDDRMDITTMREQLTASDRLGHTWTFNIPLLAVGLSGGQIVVNNPPTLSWHVKEGQEGGKPTLMRKKNGWLIR